jgi:hypothetical protein
MQVVADLRPAYFGEMRSFAMQEFESGAGGVANA